MESFTMVGGSLRVRMMAMRTRRMARRTRSIRKLQRWLIMADRLDRDGRFVGREGELQRRGHDCSPRNLIASVIMVDSCDLLVIMADLMFVASWRKGSRCIIVILQRVHQKGWVCRFTFLKS
jgi:hypothetical protein